MTRIGFFYPEKENVNSEPAFMGTPQTKYPKNQPLIDREIVEVMLEERERGSFPKEISNLFDGIHRGENPYQNSWNFPIPKEYQHLMDPSSNFSIVDQPNEEILSEMSYINLGVLIRPYEGNKDKSIITKF